MGLRFRRTVKVFPGVKLNISRSGVSASIGVPGATLNVGNQGARFTAGIPGTGLSYQHRFKNPAPPQAPQAALPPAAPRRAVPVPSQSPLSAPRPMHAPAGIASAPVEALTSPRLRELRTLVVDAYTESARLQQELHGGEKRKTAAQKRAHQWQRDTIRQTLFRNTYEQVLNEYEAARDDLRAIKLELEKCQISLGMEMSTWMETTYAEVLSTFQALSGCVAAWDVTSRTKVAKFAERSAADVSFARVPIKLDSRPCPVLAHAGSALRFQNTNGGDLFLYPAMLVVHTYAANFAVLDLNEVNASFTLTTFHETGMIPSDATSLGQTWTRVNVDGTPDRRYSDNQMVPIVAYGTVRFSSPSGLNEEFMFSSAEKAMLFVGAFNAHKAALNAGESAES
jgi:hypothetical protein